MKSLKTNVIVIQMFKCNFIFYLSLKFFFVFFFYITGMRIRIAWIPYSFSRLDPIGIHLKGWILMRMLSQCGAETLLLCHHHNVCVGVAQQIPLQMLDEEMASLQFRLDIQECELVLLINILPPPSRGRAILLVKYKPFRLPILPSSSGWTIQSSYSQSNPIGLKSNR
jgi:hypothetical protein